MTSSNTTAGAAAVGVGVGPCAIDAVLGVVKAYTTRVGNGPFPTERDDEAGAALRKMGGEYGATTGRPRRCGWFDGVAARFSSHINGFTTAAITRLDVLDALPELKVCVGYKLDGQTIDYFPARVAILERCQPVYEELPGWQAPTTDIRQFDQLPLKAQQYVDRLQELISCPVSLISVGMRREQSIFKMPIP